jgi:hypothetical protein
LFQRLRGRGEADSEKSGQGEESALDHRRQFSAKPGQAPAKSRKGDPLNDGLLLEKLDFVMKVGAISKSGLTKDPVSVLEQASPETR